MTGQFRDARGVRRLLQIASAEAETLRVDFGDIERVYASTRAEIENIDAGPGAASSDAMRERRFSLKKTLKALETVRDGAADRLSTMLSEIAKLERLAEINRREALSLHRRATVEDENSDAPQDIAERKSRAR